MRIALHWAQKNLSIYEDIDDARLASSDCHTFSSVQLLASVIGTLLKQPLNIIALGSGEELEPL